MPGTTPSICSSWVKLSPPLGNPWTTRRPVKRTVAPSAASISAESNRTVETSACGSSASPVVASRRSAVRPLASGGCCGLTAPEAWGLRCFLLGGPDRRAIQAATAGSRTSFAVSLMVATTTASPTDTLVPPSMGDYDSAMVHSTSVRGPRPNRELELAAVSSGRRRASWAISACRGPGSFSKRALRDGSRAPHRHHAGCASTLRGMLG